MRIIDKKKIKDGCLIYSAEGYMSIVLEKIQNGMTWRKAYQDTEDQLNELGYERYSSFNSFKTTFYRAIHKKLTK